MCNVGRLLTFGLLLAFTPVVQAGWFDGEYDGSVSPDKADPPWTCPWGHMPDSAAVDGLFKMVVPREDGGHVYDLVPPHWDAAGKDFTVEFRAWIIDSDDDGLRVSISNNKHNWVIFLTNGKDKDVVRIRAAKVGKDENVAIDDGFVVVRLCVRAQHSGPDMASVYVNGKEVVKHWAGFGTKNDSQLRIGDGSGAKREAGTVVWDYIRWTFSGCVPPAAQDDAPETQPAAAASPPSAPDQPDVAPLPQVIITHTDAVPKIDGKLDDPAWQNASVLLLHPWRDGDKPARPTEARLCADADHLYVAFVCSTPDGRLTVPTAAPRDNYLGGSDNVELFLDPGLDRSNYYQIALNISNTLWDTFRDGPAWNGNIQSATNVGDRQWTAELSIELSSFDRTPRGPVWGLNVNHIQADTGAFMTWAPVRSGHHEPSHFGFAAFPGASASLAPITAMLNQARPIIDRLASLPNADRDAPKIAQMTKTLQQLQSAVAANDAPVSADRFLFVRREAQALLDAAERLQQRIDTNTAAQLRSTLVADRPYAIVPLSPLAKVGRTFWPPSPLPKCVELTAARGEHESFQLSIVNGSRPMHTGRVRPLPLRNGEHVIGVADMKLWAVQYVNVDKPSKNIDLEPGSLAPDPLAPCDAFTIPAGDHQVVWVTIHTPPDAPAGRYEGSFEVYAPGFPTTRVPVALDVMDFDLPTRPALRTSFGLWDKKGIDFAYDFERNSPRFKAMFEKYADTLLTYRLTPREFPGFDPAHPEVYDAWVHKRLDQGATILTMGFSDPPPTWLKAFTDHLAGRGWMHMLYTRPGDEPSPSAFAGIVKRVEPWRAIVPDIKMQIAGNEATGGGLDGTVNVWCPLTSGYDAKWADQRRARGEEVWWYVCNVPFEPHANFQIDQQAICHRILFWQTFAFKVDGLLYWNVINYRGGDPWQVTPYWSGSSGEGALFYPGADGPLPSIRLEVIRDGMDDYDYLALLHERARTAKARGADPDLLRRAEQALDLQAICGDLRQYTRDADVLLARRRIIGDLIVQFGQAIQ